MLCQYKVALDKLPKTASADDILVLGKICHEQCHKPCGAENENCVITYRIITYEQWTKQMKFTTMTGI